MPPLFPDGPVDIPNTDLHVAPSPGLRPGGYELLRALARGGCGEVHLGRHQLLGHLRAVKVLFGGTLEIEEEAIRLYKQSVRIEDYRVLVPVEDYDQLPDGRRYYVMPLADHAGPQTTYLPEQYDPLTLTARLRDYGHLSVDEILDIADRLLLALSRLHGYGLLHLDIKPGNVVRIEGAWRLGDFGLMIRRGRARSVGSRGTPGFMPPEETPDFASDVYSLGITLLVLATNLAPPAEASGIPALLLQATAIDSDSRAGRLCEIIARACAWDPKSRPGLKQMQAEVSRLTRKAVWLEIRLPEDFDTWNAQKQAVWKERLEALGVIVQAEGVARGSVLYRVELTPAQAEFLQTAIKGGALEGVGVAAADVRAEGQPVAGTIEKVNWKPAHLRAASLSEKGQPALAARRKWVWLLALGMAACFLFISLVALMEYGGIRRPRDPEARLVLTDNKVSITGGREATVAVTVYRPSEVDELTVRLFDLPLSVRAEAVPVPAGEGKVVVRVPIHAALNTPSGKHDVGVALYSHQRRVDTERLELTTVAFAHPELIDVRSIQLTQGKSTDVVIGVKRNGNSDPLSLTVDALPRGVKAEALPQPPTGDRVGVRLTAAADAEVVEGKIVQLILRAGGISTHQKVVTLSVRPR